MYIKNYKFHTSSLIEVDCLEFLIHAIVCTLMFSNTE